MSTSKRLDGIGEYYFSQKLREIEQLNLAGKNIISLGIGSPDMPPHPEVIKILQEESAKATVHGYQSYKGSLVLRKAISEWYQRWYNVKLDPNSEILPLMGSKEGIVHICMTYLEEGDKVFIPNPGYPTYQSAVKLAGGETVFYELEESNDYKPDFGKLTSYIKDQGPVKLMFVNYPNMPTGQLPDRDLFEDLVKFAKAHDILVIHDNPYSFILNDKLMSLLAVNGALENVIELNSLSKSHNMAGWRVGMLCASANRIEEVLRFKSNMDSGMFLPIQLAAAKALSLGKEWHEEVNSIYLKRRNKVYELLEKIGCSFFKEQAGLFVWAKIPPRYDDGYALSDDLLYNSNVFITPGGIFGSAGNKYIRASLCLEEKKIEEAIKRIKNAV